MEPEPLGELFHYETVSQGDEAFRLRHGSVVIAAITSCTNTSNPEVMLAAGLLAKKAVEPGLNETVGEDEPCAGFEGRHRLPERGGTDALPRRAGLPARGLRLHHLYRQLGAGGGPHRERHPRRNLVAAAVLSGNRNFEGRINPEVRANYLASPPLVVAYALAGHMDIDMLQEPLGTDRGGQPVF